MKRLMYILMILVFFGLFGSISRSFASEVEDTGAFTFVTPNNIKVIGKEINTNEVISFNIFFKGGSSLLNASNAGIEYLTLETLLSGSSKYPKQKLYEELISMKIELDSFSDYDYSGIKVKCLKKYFDKALLILSSLLKEPVFEKSEIQKNKDEILTDIKNQMDEPEEYVHTLIAKSIFKNHPYLNSPEGLLATIPNLKRSDLLKCHKSLLDSNRLLVTFAGGLPENTIRNYMSRYFNFFHKSNYKDVELPNFNKSNQIISMKQNIPSTYVTCEFDISGMNPEEEATFTLTAEILSNKLWEKVRTEQGLAYRIGVNKSILKKSFAGISFNSSQPEDVLKIVQEEINKLKTDLLDDKYINRNKNSFFTYHFMNRATNQDMAVNMGDYELLGKGYNYDSILMENINKVNKEEIRECTKKYFRNFHIGIISPVKNIAKSSVFQEFVNIK